MSERGWFGDGAEGSGDDESERPAGGGGAGTLRARRRGALAPTIVVIVAVLVVASIASSIWTEVLWYDSVHLRSVFTTELGSRLLIGIVSGIVTAAVIASSLVVAYRNRPIYVPDPEQDALERYREAIEPLRRVATYGVPVVVGLLTGLGFSSQWQTYQLWLHRQPFGQTDPQFHLDIGFFVFTLPWLDVLVSFSRTVLIMGLLVAAFTHYVFGGLHFSPGNRRTTQAARVHLSVLLAALVLVQAVSYWIDRYELTTKQSSLITGIQYTDATAVLPTKAILAIVSIICALLFLSVIWLRTWRWPIVGVAGLLVLAIVVGGILPALIQSLKVTPSAQTLEAPYIANNIKATRDAFGLSAVQATDYTAKSTVSKGQLASDAKSVPGIRLMDPNVVSPTYQQLQAGRNFYRFPDTLDVDRYKVSGTLQDTVIGARELDLDGVPAGQRNWINDHTVYTHGYGVVAAYGNQKDSRGQPNFFESAIPVSANGPIGSYEPRIYFGEQSTQYSIVGAAQGAEPREFDYPADQSGGTQVQNTYQGDGGVAIGSAARRLAYAITYREPNFLLSDTVNDSSRLLDHRTPRDRVERVAPWLTLDGNAYPAVVDGRIQWILDGYTTTASYPNSSLTSIESATSDSITSTRTSVQAIDAGQVNYIRNSVKATVDAFDGSVHLYAWDESDPILKAWRAVFPGVVQPLSDISASLMAHLRYPEDLFKVQRKVLSRYHVTDPLDFFRSNDLWDIPVDPTEESRTTAQPPYYLSLAMPDQTSAAFSLTTSFKPFGSREVLSGFMAVDSAAGSTKGVRAKDYGTLRLLQLPADSNVKGPPQVQNEISASQVEKAEGGFTLSQFLNVQRQGGSTVIFGNLLTLPVAKGLLYVEPIFVQGNSSTSFPLNQAVVTTFGDTLSWSGTLDGALDSLFGGDSGAPGTGGSSGGGTSGGGGSGSSNNAALAAALQEAQQAVDDGKAALAKGDFTAYGQAQAALQAALSKAIAAQGTGSVTLTPGGSPTTGSTSGTSSGSGSGTSSGTTTSSPAG